ncbi:hypothetical protein [Infirmifilum sp. NZ]|uniref:hypothetical protein n=1 Tax=Infirmifilum sp. NZ TaxID=2926850 RepID=UPI0027A13F7E|nr:hypothetical protein [Infirmifilum sp. NZ]UNQ72572.1 hypothetical protein MOV14_05465 [Infirmifilum sp. NZ]
MRVIEIDEKRSRLRLVVETTEDLYYLLLLIRRGDVVYAWTTRQLRIERETGVEKGERVKVYVGIEAEKVSYSKFTKSMRLTGRVTDAPEDVHMKGSYHTLSLSVGDEVLIVKKNGIGAFDRDVLRRASSLIKKVLVISVGDDEITVGILSPVGVEVRSNIPYYSRRGDRETSIRESVLPALTRQMELLKSHYRVEEYDEVVVLTTERLLSSVEEALEEAGIKARVIKVSEGGEAGVYELLRRQDLRPLFTEIRSVVEAEEAEKLIDELFKGSGRVIVGLEAVEKVSEWGVVEEVVIVDELFFDDTSRERVFGLLDKLSSARFILVDSESEVGRMLKKLGGVMARLYYALEKT